jgi:hypothetical protein
MMLEQIERSFRGRQYLDAEALEERSWSERCLRQRSDRNRVEAAKSWRH